MFDLRPSKAASGPSDGGARAQALPSINLLLAAPRGFCAGVRRAIQGVRDAIAHHGAPVYVRRPIVHNLAVVRMLEAEGAVFVQELHEVPEGGVVILSAHGVAPAVKQEALARGLLAYDAVCPLVAKIHRQVERHCKAGRHVILIGHENHPEIAGTLGHLGEGAATLVGTPADIDGIRLEADARLAYAVQTTYSVEEADEMVEALSARFTDLQAPPSSDICYATSNRQAAVRAIAARADAIIVAGESFSSNACRLAEVAASSGCRSVQLLADAAELEWSSLPASGTIGVTAAASTPESTVAGILDLLRTRYSLRIEEVQAAEEAMVFRRLAIGSA